MSFQRFSFAGLIPQKVLSLLLLGGLLLPALSACSKQIPTAHLQVGQCFNAPDEILLEGRQSTSVEAVSCRRGHNSEVIGIHTLGPDGREIQGERRVNPSLDAQDGSASNGPVNAQQRLAESTARLCAEDFEEYVGKPYQNTKWDIYPLSTPPSEDAGGKSMVTCVALTLPKRSGSIRGRG